MNSERVADSQVNQKQIRRVRRFNRSQDKDSVSSHKRHLSQCSSENSLFKFYKPVPKVTKPINFLDQFSSLIHPQNEVSNLIYQNKKKPRTMTSKFQYQKIVTHDVENLTLIEMVKQLRARNQELQAKVSQLSKSGNEDLNKQNKPMNKLRDKTQKERIKELETENLHLKQAIQQLNSQLKEVQSSRLSEQTNYSFIDNTTQLEDQLTNNQKQIFILNEEVRKMRIQMDFINRRNYSEIITLKNAHQKELKLLKDKIQELGKVNSQLKKKNNQLIYVIKGTKEKKPRSSTRRIQYGQSLLQLSCSD